MTTTEFPTTAGSVGAGAAGVPVPGDAGPARAQRRWTGAERVRVTAESDRPGTTIVEVARRHGIDESTLRGWRRRALDSVDRAGSGHARRWAEAEKARAVAESGRPGMTIAAVARGLGVNASTTGRRRRLRSPGSTGAAGLTRAVPRSASRRPLFPSRPHIPGPPGGSRFLSPGVRRGATGRNRQVPPIPGRSGNGTRAPTVEDIGVTTLCSGLPRPLSHSSIGMRITTAPITSPTLRSRRGESLWALWQATQASTTA